MLAGQVLPANIAIPQDLARRVDFPGKTVAYARRCYRVEEMRRVEIRHENTVDVITKLARLAGIAHLDQEAHTTLLQPQFHSLIGQVARLQTPAKRVSQ